MLLETPSRYDANLVSEVFILNQSHIIVDRFKLFMSSYRQKKNSPASEKQVTVLLEIFA